MKFMKKSPIFATILVLFSIQNTAIAQKFKGNRHSITPMVGIANNTSTEFSQSVSSTLKIEYMSGDAFRMPVGLRYQYRMRHGNRIGADLLGNYLPLMVSPSFRDAGYGYTGPLVLNQKGTMLGGDIHYSKTIDIKVLEAFGYLGLGGYALQPLNDQTANYSWYIGATPEFYDFAVAATHNSVKKFMPITTFGFGARLKHLEAGVNYQYSLNSPINSFDYKGVTYNNNIRFRSVGYYVAYRFEF